MEKKGLLKKMSMTVKIVIIGVLILLMLIPISMIRSMIKEREGNKTAEQTELRFKWGGKQTLTGPILVLPNKDDSKLTYVLPDEFNVEGNIKPEERTRGIQTVLSYQTNLQFGGRFNISKLAKIDTSKIAWEKSYFLMGVSNLQGIKNKLTFNIENESLNVESGVRNEDIMTLGLNIPYPLDPSLDKNYTFNFDLTLNGTDGLHIVPIGKQTNIHLTSDWKSVSYIGEFVPTEIVSESGEIDAQWNIFDYNRDYTQVWDGNNISLNDTAIGIDFLLPLDHYQKTMRAVKYAIMFISLTFLVFFMIELSSKKRIHPVQYLLVSFALVLFYSLLLALSEHLNFDISYLLAAVAIIVLITAYSKSIFKNNKQTIFMGIFLTALYIFLYVVIQLQNMALLLGTVGLFIALATVMYTSRKVNWYKEDQI